MKKKKTVCGEYPLKRRFNGKLYAQTGNGAGKESDRRELMSKIEANKLAKDARKRGWRARLIKHCNKYLLYIRPGTGKVIRVKRPFE